MAMPTEQFKRRRHRMSAGVGLTAGVLTLLSGLDGAALSALGTATFAALLFAGLAELVWAIRVRAPWWPPVSDVAAVSAYLAASIYIAWNLGVLFANPPGAHSTYALSAGLFALALCVMYAAAALALSAFRRAADALPIP